MDPDVTITTGLVDTSTTPTLLRLIAERPARPDAVRHPPLRARRHRGGLRRLRGRRDDQALKVVLTAKPVEAPPVAVEAEVLVSGD